MSIHLKRQATILKPDQSRVLRTFIKLPIRGWRPRRVSRDDSRSALGRYVRPDPQFPMAWFGLAASS